jgi:hypothetical protein
MTEWHEAEDTDQITQEMGKVFREDYKPKDRYSDFINTFRKTDHGLRVLHQICQWGNVYGSSIKPKPPQHPIDVNEVLINEGERRLALKILSTVNIEPIGEDPPKRTTNKE